MPKANEEIVEKAGRTPVISKFNERPFSVYLIVRSDDNGFLTNFVSVRFYRGAEKKLHLAQLVSVEPNQAEGAYTYDSITHSEPAYAVATSLLQRFAMTTFSTNEKNRLPANKTFFINLRVVIARADKSIRVMLRDVCACRYKDFATGKPLDRSNRIFCSFRKAVKYLPDVFARVKFAEDVVDAPNAVFANYTMTGLDKSEDASEE